MTHISTLQLHRLRLGELAAAERAPLDAHLDACALCAGRLGHQDATRAAFVQAPVPAALAALERPSFWERIGRLRAVLFLLPAAAAAALVLAPVGPADAPHALLTERTKGGAAIHHSPDDDARAKGGTPVLEAWIQTGDSARPVYTDERVRPGTRVQLKYDPGHHRFVTLAGRDARGTVEVYGTLAAQGPGVAPAPFALTLDDAKGEQEFFAILTNTRPAPDTVLQALAAEPVRMERGEIASVVLRKE